MARKATSTTAANVGYEAQFCDISIYGQESNYTTRRLAKMNLAIRGIDAQIAHGDTSHNDRHTVLWANCNAERRLGLFA